MKNLMIDPWEIQQNHRSYVIPSTPISTPSRFNKIYHYYCPYGLVYDETVSLCVSPSYLHKCLTTKQNEQQSKSSNYNHLKFIVILN